MTPLLMAQKRRLTIMAAVNVLSVAAALSFLVVYFKFSYAWSFPAFVVALLIGFGAQIWFIAGFRRTGKGT
ncbi:hypothetical protein [Phenylobacterium sp.]|uniref:hypothetical protein n=1 Tax=Phenylobacterium sp. TaxID=1871053 RepID=UPI0025DBD72C|nr:hypothetical protein [Phenylobacterium sp.]